LDADLAEAFDLPFPSDLPLAADDWGDPEAPDDLTLNFCAPALKRSL